MSIEIRTSVIKGIKVVKPIGRLDGDGAPDLDMTLDDLIMEGYAQLVLNLSDVDYMSSAGLRALVSAYKHAQQKNGDLRLAAPTERVRTVLELAGLDTALHIYDNDIEAVNSF